MCETIGHKIVKARKEHKCEWCLGIINIGDDYHRSGILVDGSVTTWRNHDGCLRIAQELKMFDDVDYGLSGEDFRETIKYEYQDIMSEFHNDFYEIPEFKYPPFDEQLIAVKLHYKITP